MAHTFSLCSISSMNSAGNQAVSADRFEELALALERRSSGYNRARSPSELWRVPIPPTQLPWSNPEASPGASLLRARLPRGSPNVECRGPAGEEVRSMNRTLRSRAGYTDRGSKHSIAGKSGCGSLTRVIREHPQPILAEEPTPSGPRRPLSATSVCCL